MIRFVRASYLKHCFQFYATMSISNVFTLHHLAYLLHDLCDVLNFNVLKPYSHTPKSCRMYPFSHVLLTKLYAPSNNNFIEPETKLLFQAARRRFVASDDGAWNSAAKWHCVGNGCRELSLVGLIFLFFYNYSCFIWVWVEINIRFTTYFFPENSSNLCMQTPVHLSLF